VVLISKVILKEKVNIIVYR